MTCTADVEGMRLNNSTDSKTESHGNFKTSFIIKSTLMGQHPTMTEFLPVFCEDRWKLEVPSLASCPWRELFSDIPAQDQVHPL